MRRLRSRRLWITILAALGFIPLAFLPRPYMFDVVNALTVAIGVGVLFAYAPGICRIVSEQRWSGSHYLVLGIFVTWWASVIRHLWNWAWRYFDKPAHMIDHPVVAFMVWLAFMGGMLHLTARGAIDGDIPRENWVRVGVVIAAGIALALLVILFLEPVAPARSPRHV